MPEIRKGETRNDILEINRYLLQVKLMQEHEGESDF